LSPNAEGSRAEVGDPQPWIQRILNSSADEATGENDHSDQNAGRHNRPPGSGCHGGRVEGVLNDPAERDLARVPKPKERKRRFGEYGAGCREQGVCYYEWHSLVGEGDE